MATEKKYTKFWDFYPYYLTEHQNPVSRALHFVGTGLVIALFVLSIIKSNWIFFAVIPLAGYGFAWFGHFAFEKNKPATFQYPFFSLASDFVMFYHILTFQIGKKLEDAKRTIK